MGGPVGVEDLKTFTPWGSSQFQSGKLCELILPYNCVTSFAYMLEGGWSRIVAWKNDRKIIEEIFVKEVVSYWKRPNCGQHSNIEGQEGTWQANPRILLPTAAPFNSTYSLCMFMHAFMSTLCQIFSLNIIQLKKYIAFKDRFATTVGRLTDWPNYSFFHFFAQTWVFFFFTHSDMIRTISWSSNWCQSHPTLFLWIARLSSARLLAYLPLPRIHPNYLPRTTSLQMPW